jgi:hypothetical protein
MKYVMVCCIVFEITPYGEQKHSQLIKLFLTHMGGYIAKTNTCKNDKYLYLDSVLHCPRGDDEVACNISCPDKCSCNGAVFTCRHVDIDVVLSQMPRSTRNTQGFQQVVSLQI